MLLELIFTVLFIWLLIKVIGLMLRVAWGLTKVIAVLLFVLSIPSLIVCLVMAGGFLLMIPVAMAGLAFGMLKSCV